MLPLHKNIAIASQRFNITLVIITFVSVVLIGAPYRASATPHHLNYYYDYYHRPASHHSNYAFNVNSNLYIGDDISSDNNYPQSDRQPLHASAASSVAVAAPLSSLSSASLPVTAVLLSNLHSQRQQLQQQQPYGNNHLPNEPQLPSPLLQVPPSLRLQPLPPPPPALPVVPLAAPPTVKTPLDVMVDISNRLAFAVLNAHTEPHSVRRRRAQNFAYSPCGLTSVLIALWEGAAGGGGGDEIYRTMRLPWDRDVVRLGVRDMHRRLRVSCGLQAIDMDSVQSDLEYVSKMSDVTNTKFQRICCPRNTSTLTKTSSTVSA